MRLTLSGTQFCHLVTCLLYDQLHHPEDSAAAKLDPDWKNFLEVLERKGLKAVLLQRYLSMDPQLRIRYNMIKKTFVDNKSSGSSYIEIRNEHVPVDKKPGVINKVGNIIKKAVRYGVAGTVGLMEDKDVR